MHVKNQMVPYKYYLIKHHHKATQATCRIQTPPPFRQNTSMTEQDTGTGTTHDSRLHAAAAWTAASLGLEKADLEPVSGDASFRRYFRCRSVGQSIIVMDAPPDKENSASFVDIDQRLREAGLNAPRILDFDLESGFGLIEDFGDTLYRDILDENSVDEVFSTLFPLLEKMACQVNTVGLPHYHAKLLQQELALFPEWYLRVHRKRNFSKTEMSLWDDLCSRLIESAFEQPQVFVHRDFHSCNLLHTTSGEVGIIDFQDAVCGPLSYDFISLLWDRYITWPRDQLELWMAEFHCLLNARCELETWVRWCDLMSMHRNLKVVGIFARLHYRDGKAGYLDMIPRFYAYLLDVSSRYPEFRDFHQLLEQAECAP